MSANENRQAAEAAVRVRLPARRRGSWVLSVPKGPYQLPRAVQERLERELAGYKNRDAAYALATFLGRFWSAPQKLLSAFPVDRRALDGHAALGLSESQVRGALKVLVEIGLLTRCEPDPKERYQRTESGPHCRAILHRFGEEFAVEFDKANARSQRARRQADPLARRALPRPEAVRLPGAEGVGVRAGPLSLPQVSRTQVDCTQFSRTKFNNHKLDRTQVAHKESPCGSFLMGEQNRGVSDGRLEAAIEKLRREMKL